MKTTKPKGEMTLREADRHAGRCYLVNVKIRRHDKEVTSTQIEVDPKKILTAKELEELAGHFYSFADESVKIKGVPMVFDLDMVTVEWIKENLKELGIKPKTLREQTHTDPSLFSQIMNKKLPLSKQMRTIFFYYITAMQTGVHWRKALDDEHKEYGKLLDEYDELEEKYLSLVNK